MFSQAGELNKAHRHVCCLTRQTTNQEEVLDPAPQLHLEILVGWSHPAGQTTQNKAHNRVDGEIAHVCDLLWAMGTSKDSGEALEVEIEQAEPNEKDDLMVSRGAHFASWTFPPFRRQ